MGSWLDNVKKFGGDVQQSIIKVGGDVQQGVIKAGGNAQQAVLEVGNGGPITALPKAYVDNWGVIADTTKNVIGDWQQNAIKLGGDLQQNTLERVDDLVKAVGDSSKPIWERESTIKVLGPDGAKDLENALNPLKWVENTDIIPQGTSDTIKKYLPVAALGGVALLLIAAFK